MTTTGIIATCNRPDCVKACPEHLRLQKRLPEQVVVVDSSPDGRTREICYGFREVLYARNDGPSRLQSANRNIGLQKATGEIIAWLDDDAYAHPIWLEELLKPYDDPAVGAVGGRALRNQPDEDKRGVDQFGKLLPNGDLTGNLAADPGRNLKIGHAIGCNMSFRREIIESLGGFRGLFPGVALR
jgi:GT2 family glycosyltransferase